MLSDIYEKLVKESLFENDAAKVHGMKTYIVKTMCMGKEEDEAHAQEFTVQASSPEEAKKGAMLQAKEMDFQSCKVTGVDLVPNSGEELNDYGSGKDMNPDAGAMSGQVKPSDVSSELPNQDA
jgi:hypothetical protein